MICHVIHYRTENENRWGVLQDGFVHPLTETYASTRAFLERGRHEAYDLLKKLRTGSGSEKGLSLQELEPLSPITKDARILCQGANYRRHMLESGMNPDARAFNMFFGKSSAAICGPRDDVMRPANVRLLDYEVELGLVMGSVLTEEKEITGENIHELVAGIVIGNDVSARDIQIPQMQFLKGKSYRTFCPMGPVLCLLEAEDMHYLHAMNLELRVNGRVRQEDSTANLVYKPEESLSEFSRIADFNPGDVVLTGTPAGCALQIPKSALFKKIANLLPEEKKWALFIKGQLKQTGYLQPGDVMETTITSADGKINLGTQRNEVKAR